LDPNLDDKAMQLCFTGVMNTPSFDTFELDIKAVGTGFTVNGKTEVALGPFTNNCPTVPAGLIPGSGPGLVRSDCYVELKVLGIDYPGPDVSGGRVVSCTDGDPCDTDGECGNGSCTFSVAVCINQTDPNLPACHPPTGLQKLFVNPPKLAGAVPGSLDGPACGSFVAIPLPLMNGTQPAKVLLSANATAAKGTSPLTDRDTYVLKCLPRTTPCPTTSTTTTTTTTSTTTTTQGGVNCVAFCGDGTTSVIDTCTKPTTCDMFCGNECNKFCSTHMSCKTSECTAPCGSTTTTTTSTTTTTQGGVNCVAHCGDGTTTVVEFCINAEACDNICGAACNKFCGTRMGCNTSECTTPCG
jgi:hypothetical protein